MTPELTFQLDALEAALPGLIADNPDPADFWPAFAGQADVIEDAAGEHTQEVNQRIADMLAKHGRYIAAIPVDEGATTSLQDTAAMHAALNHALTKAISMLEGGGEVPWADLETAIELAVKHKVANQKDLDEIKGRGISFERLTELLARVKERYGNSPKPDRAM